MSVDAHWFRSLSLSVSPHSVTNTFIHFCSFFFSLCPSPPSSYMFSSSTMFFFYLAPRCTAAMKYVPQSTVSWTT
jgi:hypothetical protein